MSRRTDIEALFSLDGSAAELAKRAARHPLDSTDPVPLEPAQVVKVLERFLAGGIPAADVAVWAAAINAREDVAAPNDKDGKLDLVIQELAKTGEGEALSEAAARKLIERLAAKP